MALETGLRLLCVYLAVLSLPLSTCLPFCLWKRASYRTEAAGITWQRDTFERHTFEVSSKFSSARTEAKIKFF
jgi:hypothetical protein